MTVTLGQNRTRLLRTWLPTALRRILAGGLVAAAVVGLVGLLLDRVQLGPSEQAVLERIEREVRLRFDQSTTELRSIAGELASRRDQLTAALADQSAARALFTQADAAMRTRGRATLAVTVYGPSGDPVAWSGRPSELPSNRVSGARSLFIAPGPLGPRLVYVEPMFDDSGRRRLGTVAAERVLTPAEPVRTPVVGDSSFVLSTAFAPVSLRARYEGAGEAVGRHGFVIASPSGEPLLEAQVRPEDLSRARTRWRNGVADAVLAVLAVTVLLLCGPLLEWRGRARTARDYVIAAGSLLLAILGARTLAWAAVPVSATAPSLLSPEVYSSNFFPWILRSPLDFLLTALSAAAIVAFAADAVERLRLARRHTRSQSPARGLRFTFGAAQVAAGLVVTLGIIAYHRFLEDTLANSNVDVLHFSIHPWHPARLALDFGLILFQAVLVWAAVVLFRLAGTVLRSTPAARPVPVAALRLLPAAAVLSVAGFRGSAVPVWPTALVAAACVALALLVRWVLPRYRHASQAARLGATLLVLVIPAFVMYPTVLHFAERAKRRLLETQFAPQALRQRDELQLRLTRSLGQIDNLAGVSELVSAASTSNAGTVSTDAAFAVWSRTDLAVYRLTSAIELYDVSGSLVSRFALNLPEYTSTPQNWREAGCMWDLFEEVAPFGSEDRRVLHAGRGLCQSPSPRNRGSSDAQTMTGAIVVHVMLDYNTLPFISSQSPYFELFRPAQPPEREGVPGRDVEFVVYGWGRVPLYTSAGSAWGLDDGLFQRIYGSRQPFWTSLSRGNQRYAVYFANSRAGIFALGYPVITPVGHLVNLAEIATLAVLGYLLLVAGASVFSALSGYRPASGRALLREIRASFYRKLFLAFVAASVVPVLILAFVTRAYIAGQLRDSIESAAVKTAAVARRVVEDYATLQQRGAATLPILDDDIVVWISRIIDQDVNIFYGAHLAATSERDLFASGLLPTRTPANVYRAIALEHLPSFVGDEQVGEFAYMLAAAPVRSGDRQAILTVPLTLRQREIEREIDQLDRRMLLSALIFILLGAGIGYSMAERIADPVNRLTRATRRIARGDLDARIAAISSDELRRLVEAFNSMAADLQRQRAQLERTHRLEAWAEMARQVAHEIKNPLTPIQLSAEHLLRVHSDQGKPLTPILEECASSILAQVRLLRQIAGEFSSFASSPTARPTPTPAAEIVNEVIEPYRVGLEDRIALIVNVPASLPMLNLDRMLLGRALTNIIENSIHAMPAGGTLSIAGTEDRGRQRVILTIADTGVGMDEEGLRRVFEPYFSTKTTGTGLGLTIAKRNVELNGGTIVVQSERGKGTTVTIELPISTRHAHPSRRLSSEDGATPRRS